MKFLKNKKVIPALLFIALGFLAMQVPFSQIVGAEGLKFSLFDFYGSIAGAFIGSVWGLTVVAIMQLSNWVVQGFAMDSATLIRFLPMLFAVLYFTKQSKWILVVPGVAMIAFWAHPEGRAAWYYALYWLIPFVSYIFYKKYLFARALGTTFTAHSVGSVLFLWVMNLPAEVWTGLVPVVWKERGLMAIGICLTYMLFNYAFSFAKKKVKWLQDVKVSPKYSSHKI
ncbi:MAG: hypothetical protein ABII02_02510 [Candidatus Magasanikbacteria bacterium]